MPNPGEELFEFKIITHWYGVVGQREVTKKQKIISPQNLQLYRTYIPT